MKSLIVSLAIFLGSFTFLHLAMVNDSMAMNAKPACASICLAANHTIVIGAVTATVLELFLLIAIGCISIYLSVIFLSEIISSVRVRPGSAPDIITLYAHYRI